MIKKNYIIQPAQFKLDGGAMFGIIPKPLWNKVAPADEQNRIDLALRLWLIETDDKLILVDTGIGDYHGEKFDNRFAVVGPKSPLDEALKTIGKNCEQITDLIISHLHFDHIGGLTKIENKKLVNTLPNARIHLHKDHFEYALNPTDRDTGSFHTKYFKEIIEEADKKNKVTWYEGDEGDLLDGLLKFKCSYGHTPFLMHPYSDEFIYMADLIPTSNHVHVPWVMGYDIAPGQTTKDKNVFLPFIEKNKLKMIYEHDPKFWGSDLASSDKGLLPHTKYESKNEFAYEIRG